jgi:hypothetical protein
MKERSVRMSKTEKEGRTTEDLGTNWKQTQTRPRTSIFRAYVKRTWNYIKQGV